MSSQTVEPPVYACVEAVLKRVRFVGGDQWTVGFYMDKTSLWWEAREPRKPSIQAAKPELLVERVAARIERRKARR